MININEAHDIGKLYGLITDLRSERLNNNIQLDANRLVDLRENLDVLAQGLDVDQITYYYDEETIDGEVQLTKEDEQERQKNVKLALEQNYGDVIDAIKTYYGSGDTEKLIETLYSIYEQEISK
ncbi:hypothetical protein HX096_13410 [Empedobacter falsenii]|uniref:hypothetical protein n=1 Tax=Empedobacter falsenii TaxID=343874 RepID=UPI00257507DE|nr:hypothetical protein [Empedobacter falsenii]MDM1548850.1 hypothetical protein [Empedobacter falsenii]